MKVSRVLLVVMLVAAFAFAFQPVVQAQQPGPLPQPGGTVSCQQYASALSGVVSAYHGSTDGLGGTFEQTTFIFTFENINAVGATVRLVSDGSGSAASTLAGPISVPGTLTYAMPPAGSQPSGLGYYFDSGDRGNVRLTVSCQVAGCDALVPIPSQAVSGAFTQDAQIYWAPGKLVEPLMTIPAGNTYLVAGEDATHMYRKILIACNWVWVLKDKVGPNFDAVWNGKPLPTDVVE